jgi:hypothetical protein
LGHEEIDAATFTGWGIDCQLHFYFILNMKVLTIFHPDLKYGQSYQRLTNTIAL